MATDNFGILSTTADCGDGKMRQSSTEVTNKVLSSSDSYDSSWLREGNKRVVPLPTNREIDSHILHRMVAGCRKIEAEEVFLTSPLSRSSAEPVVRTPASVECLQGEVRGWLGHLLIASSTLDGALLFSAPGHVLVAGNPRFLSGAIPEGVDQARAAFARYANKVKNEWPNAVGVSKAFPPRKGSWSKPEDVTYGSGTAEQLKLMRSLANGEIPAPDFAAEWLAARRRAMEEGDRVRSPLDTALNAVFTSLEDYSIDPAFKEPEDLTDAELVEQVREVLDRID
ncbi:colicin immunity domain-containing protein [Streptomyces sp. NEAU-S7GS2]|uniref:colicin immunity domain-containing protein n=1 Tax=Streptomyces sp. NEAU-S7GS2 TaxID=2202000 RepID=UPI0013A58D34|nr:colicin immunity domain-containing protein [Streptomyces sp. NEAU-S7GS2]